jgi:putative toxin-antitoxin system antitoxin component (TIGR02293 family)
MQALSLPVRESDSCTAPQVRKRIDLGLPYAEFEGLRQDLGVSAERLAKAIGIHPRTLQRRRKDERIDFVESDRLLRFQDLFCRAAEALEDRRAAASWLGRASPRFSDLAPLEYASTEPGYQELLQVIECIADDSFG